MKNEIQRISNLMPMQEGILFHTFKEKDKSMYFEQLSFKINSDFNVDAAEKSLNLLIEKHETARTVFILEKLAGPKKVVLKKRSTKVDYKDISDKKNKKEQLDMIKKHDIERGFDLARDIPVRLIIVKSSINEYYLIFSMHHIIMDGWSFGIFLSDFFKFYTVIIDGDSVTFNTVDTKDYEEWLEESNDSDAVSYWKKYLKNCEDSTIFPITENSNEKAQSVHGEEIHELDEDTTDIILKTVKKQKITINSFFQTIWGILLSKYNNTDNIVYGSIVSGRNPQVKNIEKLTGLFINNIPVRLTLTGDETFKELCEQVNANNVESEKYSYIPLNKIQGLTKQKHTLFDSIFVFENYPLEDSIKNNFVSGFNISDIEMFEKTNYPVTLIIIPGDKIRIRMLYNRNRNDTEFIRDTLKYLNNIIRQTATDTNIKIRNINLLTNDELKMQIEASTGKNMKIPVGKSLNRLFVESVRKNSKKTALSMSGRIITYSELNTLSDKVFQALKKLNVEKGDKVALLTPRSVDAVISIIGVLKTGAAIVPIPLEYPQKRIEYIINDSDVKLIIFTEESHTLFSTDRKSLNLNDILKNKINKNRKYSASIDNPLYVIYTSGTTGKPKGVIIKQRNLINLIKSQEQNAPIDFSSKTLQFASIGFDVYFQEVFQTLLSGGNLYIAEEKMKRNPLELFTFIRKNQIEILYLPTSFFKNISEEEYFIKSLPESTRHIIVAGEALTLGEKIKKIIDERDLKIHNHYGPSETHVASTHIIDKDNFSSNPPIGCPINNTSLYVMDRFGNIQPPGIAGELFISGECVGMGYLNNEELTKNRFKNDTFIMDNIMYKTGDKVRMDKNGVFDFIGRYDSQTKIRGFRVEPVEIESVILKMDKVKEVKVIIKDDKLSAVFTARENVPDKAIYDFIKAEIPDYMIPNEFHRIDKMPLNFNGKIDETKLNKFITQKKSCPITQDIQVDNKTQQNLKNIWETILEKKNISILDDFFEIGGDSLSVMRACGLAYKYNIDLDPQFFYDFRNIMNISNELQKKEIAENYEKELKTVTNVSLSRKIDIEIAGQENYMKNVLVTGATGFLGAHIVDELIDTTDCNVYCLIRGKNKGEALSKFKSTMVHYFKNKYSKLINNRIFIINGDLSLPGLGVDIQTYIDFGEHIDTIYHVAALVKFRGDYSEFESINVFGTKQITNFALKFGIKLNHISTTGVSGDRVHQTKRNLVISENELDIGQNYLENVYIRSKFNAEKTVREGMEKGLKTSIYRVGFVSSRIRDGMFQKNPDENVFYGILKVLIQYGSVTKGILNELFEFTPVDLCSKSIVKISRTIESNNQTFHIKNHKTISIQKFMDTIRYITDRKYDILDIDNFKQFVDYLSENKNILKDELDFIVNEFNFNKIFGEDYRVSVDSSYTAQFLRQLNFEWNEIDKEYLDKTISYLIDTQYIKLK